MMDRRSKFWAIHPQFDLIDESRHSTWTCDILSLIGPLRHLWSFVSFHERLTHQSCHSLEFVLTLFKITYCICIIDQCKEAFFVHVCSHISQGASLCAQLYPLLSLLVLIIAILIMTHSTGLWPRTLLLPKPRLMSIITMSGVGNDMRD